MVRAKDDALAKRLCHRMAQETMDYDKSFAEPMQHTSWNWNRDGKGDRQVPGCIVWESSAARIAATRTAIGKAIAADRQRSLFAEEAMSRPTIAGTWRVVLLLLCACTEAVAADSVIPGEVLVDPPTLRCLGVRWMIEGDADRDVRCRIMYRAEGDAEWKEGLPLVYVRPPEGTKYVRDVPTMFAGSVSDLEPGTACEIRLVLEDPDGVSTQPIYGGPCYIFRNVMYDLYDTPWKMHNAPSSVLYFHNTTVRAGPAFYCQSADPVHRVVWRNNLHLGSDGKDRKGEAGPRAWGNWNRLVDCDLDYDGFSEGKVSFNNTLRYPSFAEFMKRNPLGLEKHGMIVDLSVFASPAQFPRMEDTGTDPPDLRLKEGSAAVDAGCVLPNINDGYRGKAPDLGAFEAGDALPHYGPRPE